MTDTDPRADLDYILPAERLVNLYTPSGEMSPEIAAWTANGWRAKPAVSVPMPTRPVRVWTLPDLDQQPEPEWLVRGMLPEQALGILVGPWGSAKSLAALDLGLSIGSGLGIWFGRTIGRGPVVYLAGEGVHTLKHRVQAWRRLHPDADPDFLIVPDAVQLMRLDDVARLEAAILEALGTRADDGLSLIEIDTLARMIPGGDENSALDMGLALAALDRLRSTFKATVLLLHHPPHGHERARGNGAILGAVDTAWYLKREDGVHVLRCDKQRDGPEFDPIAFRVRPFAPSCVIEPEAPEATLDPTTTEALDALRAAGVPLNYSDWLQASGQASSTFKRSRGRLVARRFVTETAGLYSITEGTKGP